MIGRTISTLILLLVVTVSGIWFFSKTPTTTRIAEPAIEALIVGTNAEYPPFSFIEKDQIVGFDIDVITELAKRLKKSVTLTNMSFEALIPELQLGSIHMIAGGITPTPEREKRALFTLPHLEDDALMAVQKAGAQPITHAADLTHKVVVVNQGYSSDHYVSDIETSEVVRISSPLVSTGLLTLDSGQADVYIASKNALQPFLAQKSEHYVVTPLEGTGESYALAISKKYPQLHSQIQSTLSAMIKDGTVAQLQKKWKLND
ncbi:MAG TPA: transporter substrate-binding domain-containing protein [Candidatus Babeliales bacterium]|nr:transporter substrate-binding domain-containing protein [Candidatus Babeliales bacterium]